MFGYIKVDKPNLLIKEYDTYKSIYCTLCKQLGKSYGLASRFTLSYDFVFLALVYMNASDLCPDFKKSRCTFNPLVKCGKVCAKDDSINFSAAAAMIMQYFKVKDNIEDSPFFKKLIFYSVLPMFATAKNKAKKKYPKLYEISETASQNQRQVQDIPDCSIDRACEPTAHSLSEIFKLISSDETKQKFLSKLGYCIGKWVYLIDAVDDIEDDFKQHNFNPFIIKYSDGENLNLHLIKENAEFLMNTCISEACSVYDLIESDNFKSIIGNILFEGIPKVQDQILNHKSEGKGNSK